MCVKWERTGEVTECRAAGTNGKVCIYKTSDCKFNCMHYF